MLKKCKVLMLPTNEKAQLVLGQQLVNVGETDIPNDKDVTKQHLYITSDDEIKEGDWCIDTVDNNFIFKMTKSFIKDNSNYKDYCKKIIATTDSSLTIGEEDIWKNRKDILYPNILPQPSQSFIKKYVEEYNKGNIITDVLVEYHNNYDLHYYTPPGGIECCDKTDSWETKVNSKDNTITIKKIKDSWSRNEVKYLLELGMNKAKSNFNSGEISKWIEENL